MLAWNYWIAYESGSTDLLDEGSVVLLIWRLPMLQWRLRERPTDYEGTHERPKSPAEVVDELVKADPLHGAKPRHRG